MQLPVDPPLSASGPPCVLLDGGGRVIFASPAAQGLFGDAVGVGARAPALGGRQLPVGGDRVLVIVEPPSSFRSSLLDELELAVVELDALGRVRRASPAAERALGGPLAGRELLPRAVEADRPWLEQALRAAEAGERRSGRVGLQGRGRSATYPVVLLPPRDGDGVLVVVYPRIDELGEPRAPAPAPAPPAGIGGPPRGPRRLLVVDDEPLVLRSLSRLGARQGLEVLPAADAAEALMLLRVGQPVDVALIDLVMPDMDGEALLEAMQALRPGLPVIMMSGYAREERAAGCIERGAAAFLRKPFGWPELEGALARCASAREADDHLGVG